jgi:rhodanese-related sulfurtransferase
MTVDDRVAAARRIICGIEPAELAHILDQPDLTVIDLRCGEERLASGVIPGSIAVSRSTLEWRCDLASEWRDERVAQPDRRTILVCADGFSSILAAASLAELGFTRVGELAGGIAAWTAAGLPTASAATQPEASYAARS